MLAMNTYVNIPRPTTMPEHLVRKTKLGLEFVAEKRKIFEELKENLDEARLEFEIGRVNCWLNQETAHCSGGGGEPFSWRDDYKAAEELYFEMKAFQKEK